MTGQKQTSKCRIMALAALLAALPLLSGAQEKPQGDKPHSPKKATIMSAALPGLGQFYNKKYWKIPIIYGSFTGMAYLIKLNNDKYRTYRSAYLSRVDDDPTTTDEYTELYTNENLVTLQNFYRRNRDLSVIVTALIYALNIVDAAVDAHLYHFDVGDDLTMSLSPQLQATSTGRVTQGLSLKIKL